MSISKELLSEVLSKPVTLLRVEAGTDYYAPVIHTEHGCINIYELAHKCKEWVLSENTYLYSATMKERCYCNVYDFNHNLQYDVINQTSEPEAIFQACQWVLENK